MHSSRFFSASDTDRVDDLGFLDLSRSLRLWSSAELLSNPVAWVLGPPWLGKSTVAVAMWNQLKADSRFGGRVALGKLGFPGAERYLPPRWWDKWRDDSSPSEAVWLIDGVDEGLDHNSHLIEMIAEAIASTPHAHLSQLRLLLFSRPYAELRALDDRLQQAYSAITRKRRIPQFWLTRLDREAAVTLVGTDRISAVEDLIRRNHLQQIAGYPVVLNYLKTYRKEVGMLTVPDVWKGVLAALLGEPETHKGLRFTSTLGERFEAACRIAAVLSLTSQNRIRRHSPDSNEVTTDNLFQTSENRMQNAARDVCETALFTSSENSRAFRYSQRNTQDWLTAFALSELPLPALRSALVGSDSRLSSRLREVARLIHAVRTDAPARAMIDQLGGGVLLPSDAVEPTLGEVVRALDHLESLAARAPWGLHLGFDPASELARLRVAGLGPVLAERLRDPSRPPQVKRLLLNIGSATMASEAVEAAVEIILDRTQDDQLRVDAAWMVARLGGPAHLAELEGPIGESNDNSESECRIRGILIQQLLTQGIWEPWRAALHVPPANPDLIDFRHDIPRLIEQGMSLADARQLLPHMSILFRRHASQHSPHKLPAFLIRAIDLVLGVSPPEHADVNQLLKSVRELLEDHHGWSAARDISFRLRSIPHARRQLYQEDAEKNGGHRILGYSLLEPSDWRWLRDWTLNECPENREAWGHTYGLASRAREGGQLTEGEWQEFVLLVDQYAPGLRSHLEERERLYQQGLSKDEDEARAREARDPRRRLLADRIEELFSCTDLAASDLMRELSGLCLVEFRGQERKPKGDGWLDQSAALRHRVLGACRRGLDEGVPTPIPNGRSYSGATLAEGMAFIHAIGTTDYAEWLTADSIRKWLPTALFARMSGDWAAPISACNAISPGATESALLDTIALHATRDLEPFDLRQIPSEFWTPILTDRLAALVLDDAVRPTVRAELLRQLAARSPEIADPVVAAWAVCPITNEEDDCRRQTGRNLLFIRNPLGALDLVESDFPNRGAAALEELPVLHGDTDGLSARWEEWPLTQIERLARLLLLAYPPSQDPDFKSGPIDQAQELRWLRGNVIHALLARTDLESKAALDRLAELDSYTRNWVATQRANHQASEYLPSVDLSAVCDPQSLTVRDAVRLLDRAGYRLIRSSDDLLEATLEALHSIADSVGHDLPMLYSAPNGKGGRTHLHEDALQAYLRRRLTDELSKIADGVKVEIFREDRVSHRQRLDLRVLAPCHGSGRLATVVVEIKWSSNEEVRTGLTDQLGNQYLLGEGLTHGVFFVGWSGKWFPRDGTGESADCNQLIACLNAQRDTYCEAGQPGANLRIEPFVMDVRWSRK